MKKIIYIFLTLSVLSCKVVDPEELVPSYLYINDIKLNTSINEGSDNDKVIDAWIYVNGSNIGIFELPAKIPIHAEGSYELEIFAGIKNSSLIPSTRMKYPFYNTYKETRNSVKHKIDTIIPQVTYKASSNIWIEDFEDPGVKFTSDTLSDTIINITSISSEVYEGNGSGIIQLASHHSVMEAKTNEISFNSIPKNGNPIMMELNYKGNAEIRIGVYHKNTTSTTQIKEQYYILRPSSEWNKTYLNLMTLITQLPNSNEFDFYIEVRQNSTSDAKILLDNIKIIF